GLGHKISVAKRGNAALDVSTRTPFSLKPGRVAADSPWMRVSSAAALRWKVLLFSLLAVALAGVATPIGHARTGTEGTLRVTERDFRISPVKRILSRGDVRLDVKNEGPESHELIVVRRQGRLPL